MNLTGKKFISLFLVFSLFMLSVNLYAKERQGAKLIIAKKDGQQNEGELITVKPNALLLLNREGKDLSVDVVDIRIITIVKKSKALSGAGIGLLVGGGIGAIGALGAKDDDPLELLEGFEWVVAGIITGVGALVGAIIGAATGTDKTIQIEGMTDSEVHETLDKLRKKARVRD